MRVMLVTGSFPPMKCGVGDYTARLAETLAGDERMTVGVLTGTAAAETTGTAPALQVLPVVRDWTLSELRTMVETARRWRPDLIHMQFPTEGYGRRKLPWLIPWILMAVLRKPVVITWHEYLLQNTGPLFRNSLLNLPNVLLPGSVVVVRPNFRARMSAWYRWLAWHKDIRFIPIASNMPVVTLTAAERSAIHAQFGAGDRHLIAYFGFAYRIKGAESLFDIANPARDHLLLMCDLNSANPYQKLILDRAQTDLWHDHVSVTGFLPSDQVSRYLAAADAVVLPFREGGGSWNGSLQAALAQGTMVVTTSRTPSGYDATANVFYAAPDDVDAMRAALDIYVKRRRVCDAARPSTAWSEIGAAHRELYADLIG